MCLTSHKDDSVADVIIKIVLNSAEQEIFPAHTC